jgi:hypothetical protein
MLGSGLLGGFACLEDTKNSVPEKTPSENRKEAKPFDVSKAPGNKDGAGDQVENSRT